MMLSVKDLSVRYGRNQILDHVTFSVEEGHWLMVVGPNGAGKSTLINAVTRNVAYTGNVLFEEEDIRLKKPAELARCMGVLAQSHETAYSFSVEEVVALGRYAHSSGFLSRCREGDGDAIEAALALTGMKNSRSRSILTLSGGELQRTFLAQVFAQDPKLLLLDEPTNHLDPAYQKQIFDLISDWLKKPGRAVISVIHDLSLAKAYGTEVMLLHRGQVIAGGKARDVLKPAYLDRVYGMDVCGWMRRMLSQWEDPEEARTGNRA